MRRKSSAKQICALKHTGVVGRSGQPMNIGHRRFGFAFAAGMLLNMALVLVQVM